MILQQLAVPLALLLLLSLVHGNLLLWACLHYSWLQACPLAVTWLSFSEVDSRCCDTVVSSTVAEDVDYEEGLKYCISGGEGAVFDCTTPCGGLQFVLMMLSMSSRRDRSQRIDRIEY